jgi:two-component system, NarL family, response regulator DevR
MPGTGRGWSVTNGADGDIIRVCLVDDHALIREALRDRFAREPDIEVVGEAATAQSALALVGSVRPDVAVLDVYLPDGDGVTICREIRSAVPETACLILTGYAGNDALIGAIMAGAAGYVSKESVAETLVTAVRDVAAGRSALDPSAARTAMDLLREGLAAGPGLSGRDRQVLELVGDGLTDRQIAQRLDEPVDAAKGEVRSLLGKLGLPGGHAAGTGGGLAARGV